MGNVQEKVAAINGKLIKTYVPETMQQYFYRKNPGESASTVSLKVAELLKYLLLCTHTAGGPIAFSGEIDEIWHQWILQTHQYSELMEALPGKKFVHHSSMLYENAPLSAPSEREVLRQYEFILSYVASFGGFTEQSVRHWPFAMALMARENLSVDGLNESLQARVATV